jgi:putative transposase
MLEKLGMASYPTNLTDAQWSVVRKLIPATDDPRGRGRPPTWTKREILDGIFYVVRGGIQWRLMPGDLPRWKTVYHYFRLWSKDGIWKRIHDTLRDMVRKASGKKKAPTAAILDSQSVRTGSQAGIRGYDAGKKVLGRKRHILVDTLGLLLGLLITEASVQDRDGGAALLSSLLGRAFGWLKLIWADGGYAGRLVDEVAAIRRHRKVKLEIVKRSDKTGGFAVLPKRWIVERTLGWLIRNRRLVRDYEAEVNHSESMIYAAMIKIMIARLAR